MAFQASGISSLGAVAQVAEEDCERIKCLDDVGGVALREG